MALNTLEVVDTAILSESCHRDYQTSAVYLTVCHKQFMNGHDQGLLFVQVHEVLKVPVMTYSLCDIFIVFL